MYPFTWPCKSRAASSNLHTAAPWGYGGSPGDLPIGRRTIGRCGERGSGIPVLMAGQDCDDIEELALNNLHWLTCRKTQSNNQLFSSHSLSSPHSLPLSPPWSLHCFDFIILSYIDFYWFKKDNFTKSSLIPYVIFLQSELFPVHTLAFCCLSSFPFRLFLICIWLCNYKILYNK